MIKIREKTFETNSSSTHSLVILNSYRYREALKAVNPELEHQFAEVFDKDKTYTREDVFNAFEHIGAKIDPEAGKIDLSDVSEEEFDFGYVGPIAYNDPAHKLMFVLTMLHNDGWNEYYGYGNDTYFRDKLEDIFHELDIKEIIPPKNGWTGIDHQSRYNIEDQVKYCMGDFILRKDYVLFLDHD